MRSWLPLVLSLGLAASASAQIGVEVTPLPSTTVPAAPRTAAQAEQEADDKYAQGDLNAAVRLYEEAASLLPTGDGTVRLLVVAASLEQRLGDNERAIAAMTRALVLKPDYVLSQENFAPAFQDVYYEAHKRALEQRANTAQERVKAADQALKERDLPTARAAYREALRIDGGLVPAIFGLAEVDREQGDVDAALAGYQKVLALRRSSPNAVSAGIQGAALNNLGILYYGKGFYEDAESALNEALALDPASPESWSNLGLARRKLGKKSEATEALRKAYTLDPQGESTVSNLALAYIDSAKWVEAVALLLDAAKRSPENPQLWLNLGIAQQGMENLEGSIASLQKAIQLDPGNRYGVAASAAGYSAIAYTKQGKLDLAAQQAQLQVGWTPEDVGGWINLGQAQLSAGKTAEARQSLERALALDPTRPEVSNNLGSAYYRLGDYARAAEAFQRALTMRGDYLAASDNLSMTKRRLAEVDLLERRLGLQIDTVGSGPRGILVRSVAPNSPAAKEELQPGDVIVRIEGNPASTAAELAAYLAIQPPLRSLNCEVSRAGKVLKARFKLNG
ncbi:MAG: tetratricopeptide repeat protein [Acidobacteriota bacterium]